MAINDTIPSAIEWRLSGGRLSSARCLMPVLAGWTVRKHLGLSGAKSRDLEAKTLQQDRHDQCCKFEKTLSER